MDQVPAPEATALEVADLEDTTLEDRDSESVEKESTASEASGQGEDPSNSTGSEDAIDRSDEEALNIETFQRFAVDVWQHGKTETIDELLSPQCLVHLPVGDLHGADAYHQHVESSKAAFSDFELAFEDVVAEGDRVVARWMLKMTHTGEIQGAEATGKRVSLEGITIVRISEGEIFEAWDCWNMLELLGQIDALPTFDDDEDDD